MDITFLEKDLINTKVDKPTSGTLSGHAAGEPFDKHVEILLKKKSTNVYRQYEYLNKLYENNQDKITVDERYSLIPFKSVQYLLNRGKETTKQWKISEQFEEKQNDTADILCVENNFFQILDVKTRNMSKKAMQPNIISALKLADTCSIMLKNKEFDAFNITYIGIDWEEQNKELICKNAFVKELFKCPPSELYINWSAALQIQFHVHDLNQSYQGTREKWALDFLKHFVSKAKTRIATMETQWIKKYELALK
jgi:type II restriction enzyme